MSSPDPHEPAVTPEAWREWKAACTIGKCGEDATRQLAAFGRNRLATYLSSFDRNLTAQYCDAENKRTCAWLMMEQHLYAGRSQECVERDGKSYKDLFLLNAVSAEGYLTDAFRSVAKQIVYEEGYGVRNRDGSFSLHRKKARDSFYYETYGVAPPSERPPARGNAPDTATPVDGDSVPPPPQGEPAAAAVDPSPDAMEETEYESGSIYVEPADDASCERAEQLAERVAASLWEALGERGRLIVVFLTKGVSSPTVLLRSGLFDCQSSQMDVSVKACIAKIRQADWGMKLEIDDHKFLTRLLIASLSRRAETWAESSEKREVIRSTVMTAVNREEGSLS